MATVPADTHQDFVTISKAVADPLRTGILRSLARDSFGVLELCRLFDVAQPALSHHLKLLLSAGLVTKRREGNSIFYRRAPVRSTGLGSYVASIFEALDDLAEEPCLQAAIADLHTERASSSQAFFTANAERFQNQQALICEGTTYADAALEMLDDLSANQHVLEIGPGDGDLLVRLAARFREVTAIDNVAAMLDRTQGRVAETKLRNVNLRLSNFADVSSPHGLIVAGMVLHHAPSPAEFFAHAASLLTDDGTLLVIELCEHDQEWAKDACGDLWLGFEANELDTWSAAVRLESISSQYLAQRNGFRIQLRRYQKQPLRSLS